MIRVLALVTILIGLIGTGAPVRAAWPPEGNTLWTDDSQVTTASLAGDGSGGVIALWRWPYSTEFPAWVARFSGNGDPIYQAYWWCGSPWCSGVANSYSSPDGQGGAFIVYYAMYGDSTLSLLIPPPSRSPGCPMARAAESSSGTRPACERNA